MERLTVIEDGEVAVYEEPKFVEQEVVFIMDRFGYAKTIDTASLNVTRRQYMPKINMFSNV